MPPQMLIQFSVPTSGWYTKSDLHILAKKYYNASLVELRRLMPKLKTRKAAAKRFRASGNNKIMRRKTFKSHLLEHKSSSRKRRLTGVTVVNERDEDNIRLMLPYL